MKVRGGVEVVSEMLGINFKQTTTSAKSGVLETQLQFPIPGFVSSRNRYVECELQLSRN